MTITDDAADSPQTIALTGTGTVVQVSPLALDFGDQIVGTTSDPQTATITNISNEVLRIFGVGISGPLWRLCGNDHLWVELAAGGSCTIDVTFTPGARGDRHASLKIVDDGEAVHRLCFSEELGFHNRAWSRTSSGGLTVEIISNWMVRWLAVGSIASLASRLH